MASTTSYIQLAYEQTPRYENAPSVAPYVVSTAVRYMAISSARITPAPTLLSRADELRGIEGNVPGLIDGYAPSGDISVRAYVNDLIFLLGLAGFKATVTAGTATLDAWTLTMTGAPTGGTFTITVGGQVTAPIPYNATNAQIDAAVEALSTVGINNTTTTGGPILTTPVVLTFTGALAGNAQTVTVSSAGLTGGTTPAVTPTHTTTGTAGAVTLPDGGHLPAGANAWVFTKRGGLTAKTAQILAVYSNEQVYLQGQGFGVNSLGGNAAGDITAALTGLVVAQIPDPSLTPAYDTQAIPHLRRGDMSLSWLTGTGTTDDFTWSITNPLDQVRSLGVTSYYPDQLQHGAARATLSGTIPKRSVATADMAAVMSAGTFAATVVQRSPALISGSGFPYSLYLQMPSCQLTGGDPDPLANARRFGATWNWEAMWDEASGYDAKITLVSSLAATSVASGTVGL